MQAIRRGKFELAAKVSFSFCGHFIGRPTLAPTVVRQPSLKRTSGYMDIFRALQKVSLDAYA